MQIAKFAAVPPDDGFYLQLHLLHELFGHGWMTDDAQSVVTVVKEGHREPGEDAAMAATRCLPSALPVIYRHKLPCASSLPRTI